MMTSASTTRMTENAQEETALMPGQTHEEAAVSSPGLGRACPIQGSEGALGLVRKCVALSSQAVIVISQVDQCPLEPRNER